MLFRSRWDWAREMYATARELKMPFMAGSSVPLATRRPAFELPANARLTKAVAVHGGPLESYDFHGIELLQSIVEARAGGETGVSAVEFFTGEALDTLLTDEGWRPLVDAALIAELGKIPDKLGEVGEENADPPHALRLHYKDGLQGLVVRVGRSAAMTFDPCSCAMSAWQHSWPAHTWRGWQRGSARSPHEAPFSL